MSHATNKVDWCLRKAKKEIEQDGKHKGLVKIIPDEKLVLGHIEKAEHNFKGAVEFAKIGYSDWSASAFFYCAYQCFLAIAAKYGYESANQECTFALIYSLIEDGSIDLDKKLLDKVAAMDTLKEETTSIEIREKYQYGTKLSLEDNLYDDLFNLSQEILSKTKDIIQR